MDWNSPDDLRALVQRLRRLPSENEWVEFKVSNDDPEAIGEYVSCLANSAALAGQETGYLLWGIADETHDIVGTTFRPEQTKKGNEDLYPWILRLLTPQADFSFHSVVVEDKRSSSCESRRHRSFPSSSRTSSTSALAPTRRT